MHIHYFINSYWVISLITCQDSINLEWKRSSQSIDTVNQYLVHCLTYPFPLFFPDEGRVKEEGVLVHCLAGISRSVTITMAYLMYKMSLSLNEAYDIVRAKKANISPNFHFMGQLLDFERQLHSQFLSPPALGSSPDSGIEFDRWQSNWCMFPRGRGRFSVHPKKRPHYNPV